MKMEAILMTKVDIEEGAQVERGNGRSPVRHPRRVGNCDKGRKHYTPSDWPPRIL